MVSSVQCFYNGEPSEENALKNEQGIVYVDINSSGQITYIGDNPNQGRRITPSCYSSFMPIR